MDIHTTNLGPGGTQQPTETFVTNTPFQTFVGQIKENNTFKKYVPYILLVGIGIPLWIIALK
jgi:hypothetical protein